jgi:hypothetical protein
MAKRKRGLHKEITSIFGGVPIQKDDGTGKPPGAPGSEQPTPAPRPRANEQPWGPSSPSPKQVSVPTPSAPPRPPSTGKAASKQKSAVIPIEEKTGQPVWQVTLDRIKNKLLTGKPGVANSRQKKMVILIPVLVVVLIFVFVKVLSGPKGGHPPASQAGVSQAGLASTGEIDWQIPAPYPATLRDPTKLGSVSTIDPAGTGDGTGQLPIRGILYSEDRPAVLVGTKIIYEGQEISGAKIIKINKDSVEIEMNGKTWTQKVQP